MIYLLIFIFGLAIGSFLNVVIYRLKTKEPISNSRSHCMKCKTILNWYDLIPVFSFIFYKGKCHYCGKKISWQYPIIEVVTGLLFVFVILNNSSVIPNIFSVIPAKAGIQTWIIGSSPIMTIFAGMTFELIIISLLIVIFVYDLKHYIIPDKIVFPGIIISLLYQVFNNNFYYPILAGLLASGFFLFLVLITKGKGMGLGDVKFVFLMGLILSWPNIIIALFLSFLFGAIIGILLIIIGKKKLKSQVPFGPFLVGSTIITMFYSCFIIDFLIKYF